MPENEDVLENLVADLSRKIGKMQLVVAQGPEAVKRGHRIRAKVWRELQEDADSLCKSLNAFTSLEPNM